MPNKRNGIYKGKSKLDLRGFCSEEDSVSSEVGGQGMASIPEENLNFLLDIFRNVDKEIIQAVLLEFNGSLNESIEKLSEISGEQSNQTMEEKANDLAIIACSLLTDESQPVGMVRLDIWDGPEGLGSDLGSAALSNPIQHDQQNPDNNMRNFTLPANIGESSGSSVKHSNPSVSLRNGIVKNASTSVNDNTLWFEKQADIEHNNYKSYNVFGNENNKVVKSKPDFLNSSTGSNNFVEEMGDSKLRKELVNDLSWFPNIAKPAADSGSEPHILDTGITSDTGNSEINALHENSHKQVINSSTAKVKIHSHLDNNKFYNADLRNMRGVNSTSDLTMADEQSAPDNVLLNSWSNILSEWDKFYCDIESDGFSTYCDSIKPVDAGGSEHNNNPTATSVAQSIQLHRGSVYSEKEISTGPLKIKTSQMKRAVKQKNSAVKAATFVGNNYTFQNSEIVPASLGAINPTSLPSSNLPAPFSSSAHSIGSSHPTVSREDHENSKKDTSSKGKLSPSALEFIPRPLANHLAMPLANHLATPFANHLATPLTHSKIAQVAVSSKNQKPDVSEDLQSSSFLSPRKKKNGKAKKGQHKKIHDDTDSLPCSDRNNFLLPERLGDYSSHSEDTMQDFSVGSRKNVDPMDPLGWSDIFSESTTPLLDPKPQRSRKARNFSGEKSNQQAAPVPAASPWHIPSQSQQNSPRASPPKVKHQELSGERFTTSVDTADASTSYLLHKKSENGMSSDVSKTQTPGNFIATRLPPSLTRTAGPAAEVTAKVNSFLANTNTPSSLSTPKKMHSELDVRTQKSAAVSTQSQLLKNKLQFRGVKTPVGVIRRYILEKQPVMIILRGLPGSGKSYLAKQLITESQQMDVQGAVLSTDDYFMGVEQYAYNRNDLSEAHDWNKKRALQCVKESRSPVIIDNTNTTMWELLPYAVLALENGYDIQLFEPDTPWRMKVMELARKNSHGVRKENIKRMKERWENFTLDDVLKQASYSVASRKIVPAVPADGSLVPPSSTGQQNLPENRQMTTPERANVTEGNHEKRSESLSDPSLQDMGLFDWFDGQKPRPPKTMKQKVNLVKSPSNSPKREITHDFLNQSLKKAMVNLHSMSPPTAADSPSVSNLSQNGLLVINSSKKLFGSETVAAERQLSNESWNSDSETPTVDKDIHLFGKILTVQPFHVSALQNIQKEAVSVLTGLPGERRQNEAADTSSVLNHSFSTSGSFRTVHSSSDISSYHTGDGDEEDLEGLSAGVISDDDSEDTVLINRDVQILLKERHVDGLHATVRDVETLPEELQQMNLVEDEPSSFYCIRNESGTCGSFIENQGVENASSAVEPLLNHSRYNSGVVNGIPTESSAGESFAPSGHILHTTTVPAAENIDSKTTCFDSLAHQHGSCHPVVCPSSLVDYSDSDDDSGQESPDGDVVCKELSQLCIDDHAGDKVDVCHSRADSDVKTVAVSDGPSDGQVNASSYIRDEQGTDRGISLDREISSSESVLDREISSERSVQAREISSDRSVQVREISLDRSVQIREISLDRSVRGREISSDRSVQYREIAIDRSVQDREISSDRSVQGREISLDKSTPDRETSVDGSIQSSEDSVHSGREQSPLIDSLATTVDLQAKKKKRIRKGRNPGPFIEESVKVKSKTQNWSSFVVQSSECSDSSGDSVVLEPESQSVDTCLATSQTDPYYFSIVYKLNSPAFNSLQPVDWTLRGVDVITSSSETVIHKKTQATADEAHEIMFRKTNMTVDQSTITDETLEKEEANLETLKSCFPEYSRRQLEATMAICHNDLEWVTSHLLDSPALYDMEDDEEDGSKPDVLKSEESPVTCGLSSSVKSLADMCTMLVRKTNNVDADDLEMQVIQVGEGRLQKIEMFNRYRCHSLSQDDHGSKEYWEDDFLLDELRITRATSNFKKRKSKLGQRQSISFETSNIDHEVSTQNSSILSTSDEEKSSSVAPQDQEKPAPSVFEGKDSFSNPPGYAHEAVAASEEVHVATSQPAAVQSQPVLPLEFVRHLETLYGPLAIHVNDGASGLVLDDSIARKIYNCLKLQAAKTVLKGSHDDQLKNDEALARALQDEENARTSHSNILLIQEPAPNRQSTVPGWSNQNPSWMTRTGGGEFTRPQIVPINLSAGNEHFRPHSVADTLRQLRGHQGGRAQPHKFQHRKSGSVKSVWTGSRRRGHVDSLISIMQEEMAREEKQREQVRIIESTGDMEALATRIKRIELSNLFPSMGPDVLEDIFRSTGYSKEETIRVLFQSYNIPPVPMSQDKEEILNQLRKSHEGFEHVEDVYDEDTPSEDSESSYEGYRNEARFCHQLAMDCQQQALRYQSNGMQGAALFYRQRAKKYRENERGANYRAASVLFDKGSERLQIENTLDLHFYRLDEAINAVNAAIELKEDEYRKKPDKKNSYLDIVTGWGRNSKNGKAKLKPAIIHHLYAKCFQYEEKSPGMLRVYLGKKL